MKIAICGKGGVGKTTVAGALVWLLYERGIPVLAIDADSNPNSHLPWHSPRGSGKVADFAFGFTGAAGGT